MHAAPGAKPGDGAYDLIIVSGATRLSLLGLLLVFDAGGHVGHPAVTYVKASEIELAPGASNTGRGGYVAVDGELVARADEEWERKRGEGAGDDEETAPTNSKSKKMQEGSGGSAAEKGLLAAGGVVGATECDWRMPYGPMMRLKVVRAAARVFGAASGQRGSGGPDNAV